MAVYTTNISTAPAGTRTGVISDAIRSFVVRYEARKNFRETVRVLSDLTDRELADIGLTRGQIFAAARGEL